MVWDDKSANKDRILSLMDRLSPAPAMDWLIFPEMTLSGFSMNAQRASLDETDIGFFADLARRHRTCISFGGVQQGRNNLVTMDASGKIFSVYSKIHLYSFGGEDKTYQPGSKPERFVVCNMRVVPAVCFDLRFPYLFWNEAPRTDLFVVIASWPARRSEHWMRLLQARAIENQCYVVGVNRTGRDPLLEYSGNSMIFDPLGKTVLDCKDAEGVFVASLDVNAELVAKTRVRFPFLKDRLPAFSFS